jgi:hypothetical protein
MTEKRVPFQCHFPGCTRLTDEDYCFPHEKAIAQARKAKPETVARMAAVIEQLNDSASHALLVQYNKETK